MQIYHPLAAECTTAANAEKDREYYCKGYTQVDTYLGIVRLTGFTIITSAATLTFNMRKQLRTK